VTVFITDSPAERSPMICPFKIGQVFHFLIVSHGCHSTHSLMHLHKHYRVLPAEVLSM
jgi:hypothetical protein